MPVQHTIHVIYTVQPGDTLFSIASRFRSTVEAIERANILYPPITNRGLIYPGWMLVIPTTVTQAAHTLYVVSPGETLYQIAQRFSADIDPIMGINQIEDPNLIYAQQELWVPAFIYEVEAGDSLTRISNYFGLPLREIIAANQKRPAFSPDLIYPGFRLLLPLPSSKNIVVLQPLPGEIVHSGVEVEGIARVFEGNVLMQIRDDRGEIVSRERFTTATYGGPYWGQFSTRLPFDRRPTTNAGELWVYARSPRDGSITDLVHVRVYFGS